MKRSRLRHERTVPLRGDRVARAASAMRSAGARTSASFLAAGVISATSRCRMRCTPCSCAARMPTPGSSGSTMSAALRVPAVVAVWTGADMARAATTLRVAPPIEGLKPVDLPPFPVDKVRFAGDLVACVVAETRSAAIDGAEAVVVDYDSACRRAGYRDGAASIVGAGRSRVSVQSHFASEFHGRRCRCGLRQSRACRGGTLRAAPPDPRAA